jgi:predicted 2-oxoglutarate/Fe(II)-dependent dioxygenase YbiX
MMLFVVPGFWGAGTCAEVRAAMDRSHATSAEIYRDGFVVDERVRRTYDVEVAPPVVAEVERALAGVRADISRFFNMSLTGAEGPGFLRYPTGGLYCAHRDRLDQPGDGFPRRISIVLFLSSATADGADGRGDGCCEGGALRLYGVAEPTNETIPVDISPVAGMLVAFPSDRLHEVRPVTAGVRDAIVDWFY